MNFREGIKTKVFSHSRQHYFCLMVSRLPSYILQLSKLTATILLYSLPQFYCTASGCVYKDKASIIGERQNPLLFIPYTWRLIQLLSSSILLIKYYAYFLWLFIHKHACFNKDCLILLTRQVPNEKDDDNVHFLFLCFNMSM